MMASKILNPTIYEIPERNKSPILDVLKVIFRQQFGDVPFDNDVKVKSLKFLEIGMYHSTMFQVMLIVSFDLHDIHHFR